MNVSFYPRTKLETDVHMGSPPPLHGASRTTGGVFRGRAQGNVLNIADAEKHTEDIGPLVGNVKVYRVGDDPQAGKAQTVFKAAVSKDIAPILRELSELYSPIKSESLLLMLYFI